MEGERGGVHYRQMYVIISSMNFFDRFPPQKKSKKIAILNWLNLRSWTHQKWEWGVGVSKKIFVCGPCVGFFQISGCHLSRQLQSGSNAWTHILKCMSIIAPQ